MKILFVCAGNTCRSPMAAGVTLWWARRNGAAVNLRTAGISPQLGDRVAENAVEVIKELDVDISYEYAKAVTPADVVWADLIVPLQLSHGDYLVELYPDAEQKVQYLSKDIEDPFGALLPVYRECRDDIARVVLPIVSAQVAADAGGLTSR
jgi:protein-tyrosine-phosphatase